MRLLLAAAVAALALGAALVPPAHAHTAAGTFSCAASHPPVSAHVVVPTPQPATTGYHADVVVHPAGTLCVGVGVQR